MNRFKKIREDNDLYQRDIAQMLNIDQSNYSRYEQEKVNIPVSAQKIGAFLWSEHRLFALYD